MEYGTTNENRAMQALLRPRSVAILGCSENFSRINGRPFKYFLESRFQGPVYPVNPKYRTIAGQKCFADVRDVPDSVDLAVVAVPAMHVLESIKALVEKGTPAAVVFSSGFAEMGEAGAAAQRELVAAARAGGLRFCGPNAVGILNAFEGVTATFSEYLEGPVSPGPAGFVSQSGAFGTAIAALARQRGLGFGYFVNTGNEADIDIADALGFIIEDERIKVVAGYLEGIRDGRKLLAVAKRALNLGKPLILTKVGRSQAGARAAASHTGALAGSDTLFDDICRQHGIIRARNEEEMLDFIEMFCRCPIPRGQNVCFVTQSGGAGVLACDLGEEVGLSFPVLDAEVQVQLKKVLPGYAGITNPVDVTGLSLAEPEIMRATMKLVLADPKVDIGVLWIRLMSNHIEIMMDILIDIKKSTDKCFVVCWVAPPPEVLERLRAHEFYVGRGAAQTMNAVGALVRYADLRKGQVLHSQGSVTMKPPSRASVVSASRAADLLRASGIPLIQSALALSPEQAVMAAARLSYPVAIKIDSSDISHKTDVGGVILNISNETALRAAFDEIVAHVALAAPGAQLNGMVVQPMVKHGVELVVGVHHDTAFGPVLMVGLGGIFVEILKDVQFRTVPVTLSDAEDMLSRLRAAPLLNGVRGALPVDRAKLCALLVSVSEMACAMHGKLQSLDLNPVIATAEGAVAVDWLMLAEDDAAETSATRMEDLIKEV